LYSFASAFIYPSYHEGFGIPLLEAMACGTLVLASDTEVFREVAGDAAMYFNPYNATELSRMLEAALDEPTRQEYIARGFDRVEQFSWDKCADQTYEVYEKALAAQ
jgi:glycosyltransferase involved in cell wall biosynthesis